MVTGAMLYVVYSVLLSVRFCSLMTCIAGCFVFQQKTECEIRISDWSSDVCSSDLAQVRGFVRLQWCVRGAESHGLGLDLLDAAARTDRLIIHRSEGRRGGKEGVSTCRSRWSSYH